MLFSQPPIFIMGYPRSGTSLMLTLLASHPEVVAFPVETYMFKSRKTKVEYIKLCRKLYDQLLLKNKPNALKRWCEKTPRHIHNYQEIINHFKNNVQIIVMVRHPFDIITSVHLAHKSKGYWVDFDRWINDTKQILKIYKDYRENVLFVKYEDLIINTDSEFNKIRKWLDIKWIDPYLLLKKHKIVKKGAKKLSKSSQNTIYPNVIVSKFDTKRVGKWKNIAHYNRVEEFRLYPGIHPLIDQLKMYKLI